MKTLTEKINEELINESIISADNVFFKLYKSSSKQEFNTRLLELKSKVKNKVKTKDYKYYTSFVSKINKYPVQVPAYEIASKVSDENKYFIAFATEVIKDTDSNEVIEFKEYPKIYFGNNKKFIKYTWSDVFNDVGWDYEGGRKGVNAAIFCTSELYEMPEELLQDCIEDFKTFVGKNKKYKIQ